MFYPYKSGVVQCIINLLYIITMFLILLILLIYFVGYKKYYIKFTDVEGVSEETLVKALKYEMGLSLTQIEEVANHTPYVFKIGSLLETYVLVRKLRSMGLHCEMFFKLWKKVEEGPVTPVEACEEPVYDNSNEEAWVYADEAYNLAMRDLDENQVAVAMKSPEDAMRVDALLDKAEAVADAPHEEAFWERITTLRDAVSWTLKRHWTHSWMIIGGVFLSIIVLFYFNSDNQSDVREAENQLAHVEKWTECDTTLASYPEDINTNQLYFQRIDNAKNYKIYMLHKLYGNYCSSKKYAAEYAQRADTATTEERKDLYLDSQKESLEEAEEYLEEYNEWNEMDFDDVHDYAIEDCENYLDRQEGDAAFVNFLLVLAIIMVPLYIMASYQYGYVMVKYENESAFLEKLRNWGYSIAGGLFGAGLMMQFLPSYVVTTRWSDGRTTKHTEEDPANFIIMGIKFALFVAALFVLCFTSFAIMAYSTVTGLYRNYQWKQNFDKIKEQINRVSGSDNYNKG